MGNKIRVVKALPARLDLQIIYLLIFSRIYLLVITYILTLTASGQNWIFFEYLKSFGNQWDGPHYIYISQYGYTNTGDEANFIVFLPLYPLLLKITSLLISSPQIAGVFLSNLVFVAAGFAFYKMVSKFYSEKIGKLSTLVLITFPTSYFFSTTYPESLFLLFVSLSFCFAHSSAVKSSLFAALATLTRPFGIVLWIPLLLEMRNSPKRIQSFFTIILFAILSFGTYLYLNFKTYGDLFAFQKILEKHWFKSFNFPWEGIRASWERGLNNFRGSEDQIYIGIAEGIAATVCWLLIPLAYKKLRSSHFAYYLSSVVLFTSTGFLLSGPRYLLSIFPIFILLAILCQNKYFLAFWLVLSTTLLLFLSLRFTLGAWSF